MSENYDDNDIIDVEEYRGDSKGEFSYQGLCMSILNKCKEAGSQEMRPGFTNTKFDRYGNAHKVDVPDSRIIFINTVETAENIFIKLINNNEAIRDKIKNFRKKIKEFYKDMLEQEQGDWNNLPMQMRRDRIRSGIIYVKGSLNRELPFHQEYIEEKVRIKRLILQELVKLTEEFDDIDIEA